ncbi:MAG: hypothetical protein ACRCZQ_11890 [Bacteroidales bacterium]
MKTLRFLLVGLFLISLSTTVSAKGLGTNNDIEMSETLPDYGLKSLVPGKLMIDVEIDNRIVTIEVKDTPTGFVGIRIERANGQVVLEETREVSEGEVIVLNRMNNNGKHKLIITDGHTKYEGTFNVKGNK